MELSAGYLLGLTRPSTDRTNEAQGSPLRRAAHHLHRRSGSIMRYIMYKELRGAGGRAQIDADY